jgi:hypothetical protein
VKPKPRKLRTEAELQLISNRLFYEWQMLTRSTQTLETIVDDQLLTNTLEESCAIHARALVKFLFAHQAKNEPRLTDAIAEDFFSDPNEWHHDLPPELGYEAFGIFADKQIAHIVYTDEQGDHPINQGHHKWNFTAITNAIQPAFEKFMSMVPKEKLGDRWADLIESQPGPRWDRLRRLVRDKRA